MLWKLTPVGTPFDSYLLGTMHTHTPSAYTHLGEALRCMDSCNAFAAEIPLEVQDSETELAVRCLPDDKVLQDYLPPARYRRVQKSLSRYLHFDIGQYQRLLPGVLTQLIDAQLLAGPGDQPLILDQYLWSYARERGMTMLGIETLAEQHAILQAMPIENQVRELEHLTRNLGANRKKLLHISRLYAAGDFVRLYHSTRHRSGTLRKLLLLDRNAVMAERIANYAVQQPTFFAIGAAHLAGGKGVLRFLKEKRVKWTKITRD